MRNTTKKNLKDLIIHLNDTEILQNLIDHKAPDWSVEVIVSDFKESLDELFNKIMNK